MDNLRGQFSDQSEPYGEDQYLAEDDTGRELPPGVIGQDERRMQVRAYNFWASLLQDRNFPAAEDLDPENLPDFGPYSVLLDFTSGIENPAICFLGDALAQECGTQGDITQLSDVPSRSLLSRITDHYLQIIANQAPIGFEAEFVNQRGSTILYRGILLPFSSDNDTIDFIYGVINWKELADQQTADELLLEIDQALEPRQANPVDHGPLTEWADGPTSSTKVSNSGILNLGLAQESPLPESQLPVPSFAEDPAQLQPEEEDTPAAYEESVFTAERQGSAGSSLSPVAPLALKTQGMGLADWLASARELAEVARANDDRTRIALYAAISRAYDFSLAAIAEPEGFRQLIEDAGLTMQDRAPMTPLVKLVFGAHYDKTRLTEYAAALNHAHRLDLTQGMLADYLAGTPGGLKGVIADERRMRREESNKPAKTRETPREALSRKLRNLEGRSFDQIPVDGSEFTLLVARRLPDGEIVLLGEVGEDVSLIERAAKQLLT